MFDVILGRNHPTFKFKCGLMEKLSKNELITKIKR